MLLGFYLYDLIKFLTHQWNPSEILFNIFRCSRHAERDRVRLLSRTLRGHHFLYPHSQANPVLRFQPHHPLRPHLVHGSARVHAAAGFRGEAHARYCCL